MNATTSAQRQTRPSTQWPTTTTPENVNYRLPRHLKPLHYELIIKPYFNVTQQPSNYDGHVSIRFTCLQATSKLVLHIKGLQVDNSSLELIRLDPNQSEIREENHLNSLKNFAWYIDARREFFVADFGYNIFERGRQYIVNIGFRGQLKQDNTGFYASSYKDSSGSKRFNNTY